MSATKTMSTDSYELSKPSSKSDSRIPAVLPRWARLMQLSLWFSLFSYMIYTQQNLNFFIICGRINQIIILPLITLREGGTHLTSVEYNVQSRCLMGIFAYAVALWFLSLPFNPLETLLGGKTKEFVALACVCGFKSIDKLFSYCYCNPYPRYWTLEVVEEGVSFPIMLSLMFVFQYGPTDPKHTTLLAAYFLCKFIHIVSEYQAVGALKTETVPKQTMITVTLAKDLNEAPTKVPAEKNIWRIYGNEYDMTDYVAHHPGGKETIMFGANRDDCTEIFQTYHAFNIQKAKLVLEKYRISDLAPGLTKEMLTSAKHENDPFYDELARRAAKALRDANIDPVVDRAGTWLRWAFYGLVLTAVFTGAYLHCQGWLLGSFLLGYAGAFMGAHIGHDGGHWSVSRIPFINDLALWGTSMITNPIIWQHQHTFAHHIYTNEEDHDPDLHHFHVFMRVSRLQPLLPGYKLQSNPLYVLMVFLLTDVGTCYWYALRFVFERSLHGAVDWSDRKRVMRSFGLIFHIAAYSVLIMIAPFFAHESSWKAFFAAWVPMLVCGLYFALVSQVGHITEKTLNRNVAAAQAKRHELARTSWAAEQIETTNDFAPQCPITFCFAGGLGLQIEHHLFPSLNHCHVSIIQPIVEQTAKEYNVDYKKYDSFFGAFRDTISYLTSLANEDEVEVKKKL